LLGSSLSPLSIKLLYELLRILPYWLRCCGRERVLWNCSLRSAFDRMYPLLLSKERFCNLMVSILIWARDLLLM
jgi:hypothetical protein